MDARRVRPTENHNAVAVWQVKELLCRLPNRGDACGRAPLFVFDTGYHPEQADIWRWLIVAAYTQLRLPRLSPTGGCLGSAATLAVA